MNKIFILATVLLLPQTAAAGGVLKESGLSINGQMGIYTSYLWRGFKLNDKAVQQVGLDLSYGGLTAGVWTNTDIKYNENVQSDEIDYYIQMDKDLGLFSFSAGHIYYVFPPSESYTGEFFAGASYDTVFSPSFTWYRDYIDGEGDYFQLDLSYLFILTEEISMNLLLASGLNDGLFIEGTGGDFSCALELTIPLYDKLAFTGSVNYMVPFGDMSDEEENSFYSGFFLGYEF